MKKILLIRKAKKYFHVEMDDGSELVLKDDTIVKYALYKGMNIDTELEEEIITEDNKLRAVDKGLNYLGYGMKTKKQVIDKLKEKGIDENSIDYAINKLEDYNYIDDDEYAKQYALKYSSKYGRRVIEMNLKQKGISAKSAKEAIGNIPLETSVETAKKIIEKTAKKYADDEPQKQKQKIYEALMRKGFDWNMVSPLMKEFDFTGFEE